jgi:gamma-glutamylcyclotransferase (GGCT)/AIG2-like uncharacterized protein YtfP
VFALWFAPRLGERGETVGAMDGERLPLFVFGTLRRDESNHDAYLKGRYERVVPAKLPGYQRGTAAHGFPAAVPCTDAASFVMGELFELTPALYESALAHIDLLESLSPGQHSGPYYDRAAVLVETVRGSVRAWAYVSPRSEQRRGGV